MAAESPMRTLAVSTLPPDKDRGDFLKFVRNEHSVGFERVVFHYDDRILVIYQTPEYAQTALRNLQLVPHLRLDYAEEDYVWQEAAPSSLQPNPAVYIPSTGTLLSPSEVEKIFRNYHGLELFGVLDSDELRDKKSTDKNGRAKPTLSKYFACFRDVFCAEDAVDDLLKVTNIPATFAKAPDRVRGLLEKQSKARATAPPVQALSVATTRAPSPLAIMRPQPSFLTWLHVSAIPSDVSFAKLRSHFARMKGFKSLSFQADSLSLGFENEIGAKDAATNLVANTRMEVTSAPLEMIQSMLPQPSRCSNVGGTSVLGVILPSWLSRERAIEVLNAYPGVVDVRTLRGRLLVKFSGEENASRAARDLEMTTDLHVEFADESAFSTSDGPADSRAQMTESPAPVKSARSDSFTSARSATPLHAWEVPAAADPYEHPTGTLQKSYAFEKPLSDSAIFISAADLPHVKFSLRHSVGSLDGFERISFQEEGFYAWFNSREHAARAIGRMEGEKHVSATMIKKSQPRGKPPPFKAQTSEHHAGALFVRAPWGLSMDGLQAILEAFPGYMTCRHLRDSLIVDYVNQGYAERAAKDLRETTNIRVEYSNRSAQPGNRYVADDKEDTVRSENQRRYSQHSTPYTAEDRDANLAIEYSARPPMSTVPFGGRNADEKYRCPKPDNPERYTPTSGRQSADIERSDSRNDFFANRLSQSPIRQLSIHTLERETSKPDVSDWDTRSVRGDAAPTPKFEQFPNAPIANSMGTRTLFVTQIGHADKADVKAVCTDLPGFERLRYGVGSFRAIFLNAGHAADAVAIFRRTTPHWKAIFSKKELESAPATLPGEPASHFFCISCHWTENELQKLFPTYAGFEKMQYDQARTHVFFSDVESAQRALTDLNSTTDLVSVFPGRKAHATRISVPTPVPVADTVIPAPASSPTRKSAVLRKPSGPSATGGFRHAWEVDAVPDTSIDDVSPPRGPKIPDSPDGKPPSMAAVSLFNGMKPHKLSTTSDAEHFPTRQIEQPLPHEVMTNVISIRNSAIRSAQELADTLLRYPQFETATHKTSDDGALWFSKFRDVASASTVYQSYELRETLGRGFGGVSFQYCGKGKVPKEWEDEVIEVTPVSRSAEEPNQSRSGITTTTPVTPTITQAPATLLAPLVKAITPPPSATVQQSPIGGGRPADPWALPPTRTPSTSAFNTGLWSPPVVQKPTTLASASTAWPGSAHFTPWDISQPFGSMEDELNRIKGSKVELIKETPIATGLPALPKLRPDAPIFLPGAPKELVSSPVDVPSPSNTNDDEVIPSVDYDALMMNAPLAVGQVTLLHEQVDKAVKALEVVEQQLVRMGGAVGGIGEVKTGVEEGQLMRSVTRIVGMARGLGVVGV
ncbi:hypothetical protein HKX48_002676 [Thoreauomyces humboldtii]|nr:hypothetical protein HKX48_002676 [Thoreauomyces humboldtii]